MVRFLKWFKFAVVALIALIFVDQLSIERMSESPRAAHDEFWRALMFSVQRSQHFWKATVHPATIMVVIFAAIYAAYRRK